MATRTELLTTLDYSVFASAFRESFERADLSEAPGFLPKFPSGCCGWAAIFIGNCLRETFCKDPLYVFGLHERKLSGHEWIEVDGIVVDITLDQFGEGLPKAHAGEYLAFHHDLTVDKRRPPLTIGALEKDGIAVEKYYVQVVSLTLCALNLTVVSDQDGSRHRAL